MSTDLENTNTEPQLQPEQASKTTRHNSLVWIVVIVAVAAMLAFAPYMARRTRNNAGPTSNEWKGKSAPEFSLESLDGRTVHLADFRGKGVLLNFWATWCQPCKIEMPWFEELQKEYGSQGLQVVGIAMDDASKEDIAKFAKEMGVNYPILLGKESVGDAYGGVQFLPSTFFIDRDGKVVDRIFGLRSRSEIEDDIKLALGQGSMALGER
ncbi:MAG TPA: TlpA disulfide reductase family protein [Terriglobales bacterium]|nr:TlpA disulfide reductase family protein [Terriglobales bacterium]